MMGGVDMVGGEKTWLAHLWSSHDANILIGTHTTLHSYHCSNCVGNFGGSTKLLSEKQSG